MKLQKKRTIIYIDDEGFLRRENQQLIAQEIKYDKDMKNGKTEYF